MEIDGRIAVVTGAAGGIGGALLMTWVGQALGFYAPGEKAGFIWSIIGAIVLLGGYRLIKR